MNKIVIIGGGGYIGSKLTAFLLRKKYKVVVIDRFFFGNTLSYVEKSENLEIIRDDIRYFDKKLLKNVYAVVNLAAISNDPSSELNPKITYEINYLGAVRAAKLSKEMRVKKYIFASSCSVYGAGAGELTEESSLAPISAYAESKIKAEKEIMRISSRSFSVTILRQSTVYGLSKGRMRFDLVVNLMTLHAWKDRKIFITGGGKQWRPLLHVDDCVNAFYLAIKEKDMQKINGQIFNVGSNGQNFQVYQVANMIKKHFPGLVIEVVPEDPDKRTYKVNFDKIHRLVGFKTSKTIGDGVIEIKNALEKGEIMDDIKTNTLYYYQYLMEADKILSSIKIRDKLF